MLIKVLTYHTMLYMRMALQFTLVVTVTENTDSPSLSAKLGNLVCQCKSQIGFFLYCYGRQSFFKLINLFLFSYNCLHFLPFPPPHPSQSHLLPPPLPSPLILSLCPLQQLLQTPLPTIPSPLPCGYCYNVLNFNVSGYILFAFFFC